MARRRTLPENIIDLKKVPPLGTLLIAPQGMLTLVKIQPYTRQDGSPSQVLVWQHKDGRQWTSGLRSHSLGAVKP